MNLKDLNKKPALGRGLVRPSYEVKRMWPHMGGAGRQGRGTPGERPRTRTRNLEAFGGGGGD